MGRSKMEDIKEKKNSSAINKDECGEVIIADEVISIIAGISATEVEGVDSMAGGWSGEIIARMGFHDLSKGVKVSVEGEYVSVELSLNIRYGYSIPEVSREVQEKVCQFIESMTGLSVMDVNIRIAGVTTKENE